MATELEIKLTLSEQAQSQALSWLLAQQEARAGGCKTLVNRYYDTPDADLNKARAALRVRQAGDRYIQTLKTQGEFVGGAHRRQEWEWPLEGPELDLALLKQTPISEQVNLDDLRLAFETNFQRQIVMLEAGPSVIEVAVDSGDVLGGGHAMPLHEVEFELKGGEPGELLRWARALALQVPVFLNLISKAEQGYYLADIYRPEVFVPGEALSISGLLRLLSVSWLTGDVLKLSPSALNGIDDKARHAGFETLWSSVSARLSEGVTVNSLLGEHQELGVLQLALADQG